MAVSWALIGANPGENTPATPVAAAAPMKLRREMTGAGIPVLSSQSFFMSCSAQIRFLVQPESNRPDHCHAGRLVRDRSHMREFGFFGGAPNPLPWSPPPPGWLTSHRVLFFGVFSVSMTLTQDLLVFESR
jgi:hypothetical protein